MRPQDLMDWLNQKPFEPFMMEITNGEQFTVSHPEQLWVGRSRCYLGLFDRTKLLERTVHIALMHIVKIEPAAQANGSAKRSKGRSKR